MSELDQVLPQFQRGRLEYGGGYSNHGPMAAEALDALGHAALIPALADVYTPRLGILEEGELIAHDKRRESLGNGADADWVVTFCHCVEDSSWEQVLSEWLPHLLPGLFAAAGHGLLRTAHAVRAVRSSDSMRWSSDSCGDTICAGAAGTRPAWASPVSIALASTRASSGRGWTQS